jgi:uncharacterized protein YhjY with autotransporter beta-barrel domain
VLALGFVFIDYGWAQTCAVPGYLTPSQSCGAITNSGTVSTAGDVVYSDGSIVSITNTGTIASTGVGNNGFHTSIDSVGLGIGATNGANSATLGTLDNYGTISASNSPPQDMNAAIAAHGTITNLNNYGSGILSGFFGVVTTNLISNFSNAGHIAGVYEGIHLFGGSAITSLDNSSSGVISGGYFGIENQGGTIGAFTNEGTVTGGVVNTGSIGSITTAGSIDHLYNGTNSTIGGGSSASALSISAGGSVGTVANFGNISSASPNYAAILLDGGSITGGFTNAATGSISAIGNIAIRLVGTSSIVGGLANSGSISSTSNAILVNATSAIDSITNTGSIYSTGGGAGILNSGTIGTLNNAQGAGNSNGPLTLSSKLPSNYNIIINGTTSYGQLAVTSPNSLMTFGIGTGSTLISGHIYLDVLQGFSTLGLLTNTTGTYNSLGWSLIADNSNPGDWNLAYDVYFNLGPSTANTQQSLVNTASALQNTYILQNTTLANSFSYDCNEFGANGVCISAGGRNTAVSAANGLNNTSALLIAAYRPSANYRIGAYADQNLSVNNAGSTVNLGNNTPLIGLFGAWNERLDGAGTEVKVSAAYGQKNATVTRSVVGTGSTASEAGNGGAPINSQGAQITAKYGFGVAENVIVSPYIGMRYTQNNMNGYTEAASSTVTAPLTYSALNTNATTALAGVGASYKFIPQAGAFASAGVETDTNTANGSYYGTNSTIAGLTPVNFNSNPVRTRPTAMLGAYYDVEKNQRFGINAIYRQEPYQGVSTTTVMATYTVGL